MFITFYQNAIKFKNIIKTINLSRLNKQRQ